jgi:hypothetical protein
MERFEYLSEKHLARRWGMSHRTLERWRHEAQGPAYLRLGGRILYRVKDIEAFEAARWCSPSISACQVDAGAQ